MLNSSHLLYDELKQLLHYNPINGWFTWKQNSYQRKAGARAGAIHKHDVYRTITIKHKKIMEHRLAWFYMKGEWPKDRLDHKNKDKADNRFENLREATPLQNARNYTKQKNTSSKYYYVSKDFKNNKWIVAIRCNGKTIYHSRYKNEIDAAKAADREAKLRLPVELLQYHSFNFPQVM